MADFNILTGFKRALDNFDEGVYGVAGFFDGKSRAVGQGPDNMCFREGHGSPLFKRLRL